MRKVLSQRGLKFQLQKCRLLALDFDGVLTDNGVYVDSKGREMVRCDKYDSTGLGALKKCGVVAITILTREPKNGLVPVRAKKMGIDCHCGLEPGEKLPKLQELTRKLNINLESVCYIGNDINDLDCLKNVGLAVAVANYHLDILGSVDFVTSKPGGHGAVREICDLLMKVNKKEA